MRFICAISLMVALFGSVTPQTTRRSKPKTKPEPTFTTEELDAMMVIPVGETGLFTWTTLPPNIHRQTDGTVKIWITLTPKEDKWDEIYEEIQTEKRGYDPARFNHSLMFFQVHCGNNMMGLREAIDYDQNGNVLHSYEERGKPTWDDIVPGSIGSLVAGVACRKRK